MLGIPWKSLVKLGKAWEDILQKSCVARFSAMTNFGNITGNLTIGGFPVIWELLTAWSKSQSRIL